MDNVIYPPEYHPEMQVDFKCDFEIRDKSYELLIEDLELILMDFQASYRGHGGNFEKAIVVLKEFAERIVSVTEHHYA